MVPRRQLATSLVVLLMPAVRSPMVLVALPVTSPKVPRRQLATSLEVLLAVPATSPMVPRRQLAQSLPALVPWEALCLMGPATSPVQQGYAIFTAYCLLPTAYWLLAAGCWLLVHRLCHFVIVSSCL
jgi:hypothetical protein